MRIFKLVAAVGLLMSTAACAVYTRDYPSTGYYAYPSRGYYAYNAPAYYGPPVAYAYRY